MKYYIYKITNLINNKAYIGKTNNIKYRWSKHKSAAKNKQKNQYFYLHASIDKYGVENFSIEQIEECETEEISLEREIHWIKEYNSTDKNVGMNLTIGGDGTSGHTLSEEMRQKISDINKGRKLTEEHRKIISETHKGKKKTEEQKRKIGEAQLGEKNHRYGKHLTEEHKKAVSKAHKGKIVSEETREKHKQNIEKRKQNGEFYFSSWKLTYEIAEEIREIYKKGGITYPKLAEKYNVSWSTIYSIIKNRTWKDNIWKNINKEKK